MKRRDPSFSRFQGAMLGAISIVALVVATVVSLSIDSESTEDTGTPPALVAAG